MLHKSNNLLLQILFALVITFNNPNKYAFQQNTFKVTKSKTSTWNKYISIHMNYVGLLKNFLSYHRILILSLFHLVLFMYRLILIFFTHNYCVLVDVTAFVGIFLLNFTNTTFTCYLLN